MVNSIPKPPTPVNEPVLGYLPGSKERAELEVELKRQSSEVLEIPCIINGKEVFTGDVVEQVMPHNHGHVAAGFSADGGGAHVDQHVAGRAATAARPARYSHGAS